LAAIEYLRTLQLQPHLELVPQRPAQALPGLAGAALAHVRKAAFGPVDPRPALQRLVATLLALCRHRRG
jgi:hypothetical protein